MKKKTINGLLDYAYELEQQGRLTSVLIVVSDENGQGSYLFGNVIRVASDLAYCMHNTKDLKEICEMAIYGYNNVPYPKADR